MTPPPKTPRIYYADEVDSSAVPTPPLIAPKYPEALRVAGIDGEVIAEFVVNKTGRVDTASFKAVSSTDGRFTAAVREAVLRMRFIPAYKEGTPVPQMVRQPFNFRLDR